MLGRVLRNARLLTRSFSGGDDPYMLHLHQQPDKYPQYAHLHWHTADPHEVGKYAKFRSKEQFGSHVTEDPEPIDWLPSVGNLEKFTRNQRHQFFAMLQRYENDGVELLMDTPDYNRDDGLTLWDSVKDIILATIKPKQMEDTVKFAQNLIAEYKAAGVTVTKEKLEEHVHLFFMSQLTRDQAGHLDHELAEHLRRAGAVNSLNDG